MSAYDIELKPKVVDDSDLKKIQKQIEDISSKKVTISLTENLKTNTTPEELNKFIRAAQKIQALNSGDKNITLNINTEQAGKSLDNIIKQLDTVQAKAKKNVALNLSVNATGETNSRNIKNIVEAAKVVSTLRSGTKNISLAIDIEKVGEQVDQAMALIRSKITGNAPMVSSNIGIDPKSVANGIDETMGKSATFKLNVDTQIDSTSLKNLMDQVDRIVALTPDQIDKEVKLRVNVDNFVAEVQEALATLNSINPDLMTSSQAINSRFDNLFARFTSQKADYQQIVDSLEEEIPERGTSEYSKWFVDANEKAKKLYNTIQLINNLVANNEFLFETRQTEVSSVPFNDQQLESFKKFKDKAFGYFSDEVEDGSAELEELKKKFEQLFKFSTDASTLTDGLDKMTDGVKGTTKSAQSSLDVIKKIDSVTNTILTRVEKMEQVFAPLVETVRELSNAIGTLNTNLDTTQANSFTPMSNNIDKVLKNIEETNTSLGNMATNIKTVSDSITKIMHPFDVLSFKNVSDILKTVEDEYQRLTTEYADKTIKLNIESNIKQALGDTADQIKNMTKAQRAFEKWSEKYKQIHPEGEATSASANGAEALANTLAEYSNIVSGDSKEISLSFTQTGLYDILKAYREIADKIVTIEFELANYENVSGVIDKLNEAGAINKGEYIDEPHSGITLDPEALAGINGNISTVITELDNILKLLPTLKSGTTQEGDPVTKGFIGGIYNEIQNSLSRIISILNQIDGKVMNQGETENLQNEDTVTNSLLDDIRNDIGQMSVYVNEINEKLATLLSPEKSKQVTKDNDVSKINTTVSKIYDLIKQKLDKVPDRLSSIQTTNSNISKHSQPIQTNTGNTSKNINYMYKSLGSKADGMITHLTTIANILQQGATIGAINPDSLSNANADKLVQALNALTASLTIQQTQNTGEQLQRGLLPITGMMPNVGVQTSLQTQATDRIKDFQKALSFIGDRNLSGVFGSKTEIESYINALKQLNSEIATATKTLNRNDATEEQRREAEDRITQSSQSLNSFMNGNNAAGISADRIANINQLVTTLNDLNNRIGNVDKALPNLENLQSALKAYDISIDPINRAVDGLTDVRRRLGNLMTELNSENLDANMVANVQSQLAQTQNEINALLTQSNQMLDTNNADSFKSVSKGFLEAESEIKKFKSQVASLKKLLQDLKDKNVDLGTINMGNGRSAKEMETFISQYENFLNTSKNVTTPADMQTFAANFQANYQTPLRQYIQGLTEARHQFTQLQQAARESSDPQSIAKSVEDLTARMIKWKQANSQAFKIDDYARQYNKIFTELTSGTISSREAIKKLQTDFAHLNRQVVQAGYNTKSFTTKLKEMFKKYGGWTLVTKTMNIAMRLIRNMVTQVKELDTSMTNLRKVTEATGNQLNTFLESAGKGSVSLGASLTDYVDAVSEFSRLGKSLDEAQKLGELATTYKTVAEDLDIKTASQSIISTMQAFEGIGVQADEIVDKFNYVGNNFAISSKDIGEALQRSAAALNGAQNSLSESIALATAGNEIVQNAETIGTSLKTISARIRGTKSELGDDAEDLTITTSKLRKEIKALTDVDIMNGNNYKSTYQILKEIAEVYDTLDGSAQARIADLLGGKVGMNSIQAILGNFKTAEKIVEELDSGLAKGSATKELSKSLDSIQGKLNQLKSTWQQFSSGFLDTGVVKGVVDALKGLINTLDKLLKVAKSLGAILPSTIIGLTANKIANSEMGGGGLVGIKNKRLDFMTGIQPESLPGYYKVKMDLDNIRQAEKTNTDLDTLTDLSAEMREYAKNTNAANRSISNFYATQMKSAKGFLGSVQAIKTYNNMTRPEQRLAFADAVATTNKELGEHMKRLQGANAKAGAYFVTLKAGLKDLAGKVWSSITNGIISLVASMAIGALIKGIQYLTQAYDRMLEKNAELSKSFKEITDEYKDGSDEINSLMTQYANIIVTTSDLSTAQSELIDIQEQLAEALDIEKDKLDLVGGSYAENIKLIQELRKESAKAFVEESHNQEQYEAAKNRLAESALARHQEGGFVYSDRASQITAKGYGDWDDDITAARIINQYSNAGLSSQANRLIVGGTIDEQIETLEAINNELTKLWKNKPSDANERAWLNAIQERIDTLKEEKTTAEELIKIYEDSEAVRDSNISDNIYSKIADAEEIIEKLQTATNAKEIIELSNAYRQLKNEIYSSADSNDTVALDIFNSFFDTVEKNIDQRILDINNKTTVLENAFKKYQDETYDKFTNKLSKLDSAIKTVSAGDFIDESSMNELIKMDAATLDDFQKTASGYTISLDNLLKIRKRLINEQREDISDTLDEEKTLYADQLAQIEQLKKDYTVNRDKKTKNDLEALKKQAEETNKRIKAYQAWDKMVFENLLQLEDEIYEKVTSKISKIDSAIKTISTGEYVDASALLELIKLDSSLAGQFKQTIEGYTLSLDTLYEIRKKLISDQEQDIKKQIEENKKYIKEQQAILTQARAKLFDKRYGDKSRYDAGTQAQQAQQEINQTQERIELLETYLDLVGRGTDKISLFQQAISDVKGFRDNISALYSDEGLDDQFFIDHPELLRYRNDISALAEEIQKLANAKASPVIEQLRTAMNESLTSGDFDGARKYNSMIEQLTKTADQSNLNMLEKQKKKIREQVEEKERYIKKLERQKDKEQKILDKLNKQKEALEKQEEKYQTANKTAQDYIDELVKSLEKETDALEENKQVIEDDFDARIQAIKDAMDAIDKETEAIDKEAEAQERLNDLKEKELALEKARNQKVRVYTAERGWVIESDAEAIAKAQKDYDDALKDYNKWKHNEEDDARKAELQAQIDALEAEKEATLALVDEQIAAIEAQKKEFEEYKQLWEDTLNAYQKMQDHMTAAAILGSDWREKLAQKDIDIVNNFAEEYKKIESELHGVVEKKIEKLDKVIEKYDEEITKQNDLKSAQESYLSYYETYSKKFVDLTDAQTEALEKLKKALNLGDSEAALDAVVNADEAFGTDKSKNNTKLSSRYQLMDMYTRLMQTAPTALVDGLRSNFEAIKNLPSSLKNILSTISNNNTVNNDNRNQNIIVNNPGLAMTETAFMAMLTGAFAKLNSDAQIGKK